MGNKEQILAALPKNRKPIDYVREFISVKGLLVSAGYKFTQQEYCESVGITARTLRKYLQEYEEEVIEELVTEERGGV